MLSNYLDQKHMLLNRHVHLDSVSMLPFTRMYMQDGNLCNALQQISTLTKNA